MVGPICFLVGTTGSVKLRQKAESMHREAAAAVIGNEA